MNIKEYTVPDFLGRDTEGIVTKRIQAILDNIKNRGVYFINRKDCVTGYDVDEFYDWDLYFECLFLSHFGISKFCRSNVELFLDMQHPSGYIPRTVRDPRPRQHFKPFLAQTVLLGISEHINFY